METENHLYPFFWQHGEEKDTLVDYVGKIHQSGMKAVCIEPRPHPDFVGDKWWRDLGIILKECKKRDMKVWILDDAHFPTGGANGKIKELHPEYMKQYLTMRRFDVVGPMKGARIDTAQLKGRPWEVGQAEIIELLGVYLIERHAGYNQPGDPVAIETAIDITDAFQGDTIYVDIPEGHWSVVVVFSTHEGGEEATKDYLNPLVAETTQVLVDEVYEKYFTHVGEYFGDTITAFFSDEPRFGNIKGADAVIGSDMVLPWRPGLEKELPFDSSQLPLLWISSLGEEEREVRYAYMDLITQEYNRNFVKILADWSEAHGVDYLGHNIEDNGAHARLGYGAGHFFRGQEAQHFSGIDVIGGQVVPGMNYHHDAYQTGGSDGQFYHYALAKLGASAADLYPHKKHLAMCEAFGAYGWNEGLKTMKWIADHLIVRGINYIVPHAFSPKEYPDWDCPPHFYARGNNPQFRYMPYLTEYLNRLMTIFSGGKHQSPIALFYPAEFEWAGKAMPVEVPARALTQAQLDFDIVSKDLLEEAEIKDQQFIINDHVFKALVLPYAEYIPQKVMEVLNRFIAGGMKILLVDQLPKNYQDFVSLPQVCSLDELTQELQDLAEVELENVFPELVYYRYQKDGKDYILFFNESVSQTVDTKVNLPFLSEAKQIQAYNAYEDIFENVSENHLLLPLYQTLIWVIGDEEVSTSSSLKVGEKYSLLQSWKVEYADAFQYPNFQEVTTLETISPLNELENWDRVSGTVAYETSVIVRTGEVILGLDLGRAYEIAEVFVNGQSAGVKLTPPYIFNVENLFKEGENQLRIEVTNTLGTEFRGGLNQYLLIEPLGLTKDIKLFEEEKNVIDSVIDIGKRVYRTI